MHLTDLMQPKIARNNLGVLYGWYERNYAIPLRHRASIMFGLLNRNAIMMKNTYE